MFTNIKRVTYLLSIGLCGIIGCAGENASSTATPPAAPALKPDVPQAPDAAVKAVLDGLKASKPIALWNAMTSAQQADFNRMIRDFAAKADPEVWSQTVANLKKLALVAETKKDFILKSPLLASAKQIKLEDLKAGWDPGLKLLKTLLQSELVDRKKMKDFDGGAFFGGTGATLLAQIRTLSHSLKNDPLKQIDEMSATVTKDSDRTATAIVSLGGPKKDSVEIPIGIQDGKWTSDRFMIVQYLLNSRVVPLTGRFLPYSLIEWKDDYLADMKRIGKILDQLQAAKTSDAFDKEVTMRVLPYVLQKSVQFSQKPKRMTMLEVRSLGRPKETAMIVVKGDHFGDEPGMLELIKLFRELAASGKGMSSGPEKIEDSTVFLVSPVSDTDALAKQIHLGTVTKVNVRKNTIWIELPASTMTDKTSADANGANSKSAAP